MSGWSRTTKPAISSIPDAEIFGVDELEAAANPAIASPGWVRKRTIGTRTLFETLVAMKTGPTETSDDADIPDFRVVITSDPVNRTVAAPASATFTVVAESDPAGGTLSYQWEVSTNGGGAWANVPSATLATLTIANSTGLNNNQYRCAVSTTGGAATVRSAPATLTVT